MIDTIGKILLIGAKIFTEERQRHFEKLRLDVEQGVKDAENKLAPDYSDAKLALAIEAKESFLVAYEAEFDSAMTSILSKVGAHV